MISIEDAPFTYEFNDHFRILPSIMNDYNYFKINKKKKVSDNFYYISNRNDKWIKSTGLRDWLKKYPNYF